MDNFTNCEKRVYAWLVQGESNKEIAHHLSVSEKTIKAHVTAVLKKLGLPSRSKAIVHYYTGKGLTNGSENASQGRQGGPQKGEPAQGVI